MQVEWKFLNNTFIDSVSNLAHDPAVFEITNLSPGTLYVITVRAQNGLMHNITVTTLQPGESTGDELAYKELCVCATSSTEQMVPYDSSPLLNTTTSF